MEPEKLFERRRTSIVFAAIATPRQFSVILPIRQQTQFHMFQVLETQEGLVAELALERQRMVVLESERQVGLEQHQHK